MLLITWQNTEAKILLILPFLISIFHSSISNNPIYWTNWWYFICDSHIISCNIHVLFWYSLNNGGSMQFISHSEQAKQQFYLFAQLSDTLWNIHIWCTPKSNSQFTFCMISMYNIHGRPDMAERHSHIKFITSKTIRSANCHFHVLYIYQSLQADMTKSVCVFCAQISLPKCEIQSENWLHVTQ